jgi:hypothetical protein
MVGPTSTGNRRRLLFGPLPGELHVAAFGRKPIKLQRRQPPVCSEEVSGMFRGSLMYVMLAGLPTISLESSHMRKPSK